MKEKIHKIKEIPFLVSRNCTKATASRAAKATMSAQETTPGHTLSNSALAFSISSNPLTPWCDAARFSEAGPLSIKIEPSHPYSCHRNQSHQSIKI